MSPINSRRGQATKPLATMPNAMVLGLLLSQLACPMRVPPSCQTQVHRCLSTCTQTSHPSGGNLDRTQGLTPYGLRDQRNTCEERCHSLCQGPSRSNNNDDPGAYLDNRPNLQQPDQLPTSLPGEPATQPKQQ